MYNIAIMILVLHIAVAVSSLVFAALTYVSPSKSKVKAQYGLIAATLATGTVLVLSTGSHLMSACISGLAYLSAVSVFVFASKRKLSKQNI